MKKLKYKINFLSDAEPGSGYGTETINGLVPRDAKNRPIITGAHIKGVFRDYINRFFGDRLPALEDFVCGAEGASGFDEGDSLIRFCDALPVSDIKTGTVTRTAINDFGVAEDGALRTQEVILGGSVFSSQVYIKMADGILENLLKGVMMSISALGGNRQRGAGRIIIEFDAESANPGDVLPGDADLKNLMDKDIGTPVDGTDFTASDDCCWLQLTIRANENVCCPENPVTGMNTITSGLGIPASAVQGALLTKINQSSPKLADGLFASSGFRVWPCFPVGLADTSDTPLGVRVSLSYKVSKTPLEGGYLFRDNIYEQFAWHDVPANAALKGCDGVLRVEDKEKVSLWKAGDMPRSITTHCSHYGGDKGDGSLFSVESQSPMTFTGLLCVPANALDRIVQILADDNFITIGKARSVRGGGEITLEEKELGDLFAQDCRTFIVQSPILVEQAKGDKEAFSLLKCVVEDAGWGEVEVISSDLSVAFGWNRKVKGGQVGETNRLQASCIIKPGSVFKLKQALDDLPGKLAVGLGGGRERGFGAVLPHPGISGELYETESCKTSIKSVDSSGKLAFQLYEAGKGAGPSSSQIAALAERISRNPVDCCKAKAYLKHIKEDRPLKFWKPWKKVEKQLLELFDKHPEVSAKVLKVWQDLTICNREV